MAELVQPMEEFRNYLVEDTDYGFIDFGDGLIVVFCDDEVNVRQYHEDGTCLSSWVEKKEFFEKIGRHKKEDGN